MPTKPAEPEILADRSPTDDDGAVATVDTGSEAAHRLTARLAGLNLDAETLELLLAVLATDVCDHLAVDSTDAAVEA